MKILNMYATFGKLNEKQLTLSEGLNVIYGANESGKSTWSAFIRAMLYGISTREQSKIGHLADKEKYAPWSGAPMYGKIEFLWQDKRCILERTANRAGILQKAKITEADTGIELDIPEPVGETLLGIRREVFERTAFIAQSQLAVSADKTGELEKKIVALATTGESDFSQTQIIENLEKKRRKIKNYKKGELPDIEEELRITHEKLASARDDAQHLNMQNSEIEKLSKEEQKLSESIESLRIRDAKRIISYIENCERERDECALKIEEIKKEKKLTLSQREQIEEKLKQFQEKEEDYTNCIEKLRTEKEKLSNLKEVNVNKSLPLIWAIICAVILGGVAAVFLKWFVAAPTALLTFIAVYFIVKSTYLKKNGVKSFDELSAKNEEYTRAVHYVELLSDEKESAEKSKNQTEGELKSVLSMVGATVSDAEELISTTKKLEERLAEAEITLIKLSEKAAAAKKERDVETLKLLAANEEKVSEYSNFSIEEIYAKAENLKAEKQRRVELIAALKQKIALGGSLGALENKISELEERLLQKQKEYNALTLAIDSFSEIQTELQSRFAPETSKRAGEIFADLTGGHFSIVQIKDADMNLSVAEGKGTPPRGILELSGGTLDELYLAVRLALCEQLLSADVPIILDDAFVNFDDERLKSAINFLKSKKSQVLIFTCHTREKSLAEEHDIYFTSL